METDCVNENIQKEDADQKDYNSYNFTVKVIHYYFYIEEVGHGKDKGIRASFQLVLVKLIREERRDKEMES